MTRSGWRPRHRCRATGRQENGSGLSHQENSSDLFDLHFGEAKPFSERVQGEVIRSWFADPRPSSHVLCSRRPENHKQSRPTISSKTPAPSNWLPSFGFHDHWHRARSIPCGPRRSPLPGSRLSSPAAQAPERHMLSDFRCLFQSFQDETRSAKRLSPANQASFLLPDFSAAISSSCCDDVQEVVKRTESCVGSVNAIWIVTWFDGPSRISTEATLVSAL